MKHSNRHALLGLVIGFSYTAFVFFSSGDLDQNKQVGTGELSTNESQKPIQPKEQALGERLSSDDSVDPQQPVDAVISVNTSSTIVSAN